MRFEFRFSGVWAKIAGENRTLTLTQLDDCNKLHVIHPFSHNVYNLHDIYTCFLCTRNVAQHTIVYYVRRPSVQMFVMH